MLPCSHAPMLPCSHAPMLPCSHAPMLPCAHAPMRPPSAAPFMNPHQRVRLHAPCRRAVDRDFFFDSPPSQPAQESAAQLRALHILLTHSRTWNVRSVRSWNVRSVRSWNVNHPYHEVIHTTCEVIHTQFCIRFPSHPSYAQKVSEAQGGPYSSRWSGSATSSATTPACGRWLKHTAIQCRSWPRRTRWCSSRWMTSGSWWTGASGSSRSRQQGRLCCCTCDDMHSLVPPRGGVHMRLGRSAAARPRR